MYTIQANPSGTRSIEVSNENLRTIEKYALFRHLIDSTGIVDEVETKYPLPYRQSGGRQ